MDQGNTYYQFFSGFRGGLLISKQKQGEMHTTRNNRFPLDAPQFSVTNFWGPKENIPEEVMQKKVDAETSNLDAYDLV